MTSIEPSLRRSSLASSLDRQQRSDGDSASQEIPKLGRSVSLGKESKRLSVVFSNALRHTVSHDRFSCFVPRCVQRAIAGMSASTDPEPGPESFYAAVLFADISGFTAMTERLAAKSNGAELLSQKLNDFFSSFLVIQ